MILLLLVRFIQMKGKEWEGAYVGVEVELDTAYVIVQGQLVMVSVVA